MMKKILYTLLLLSSIYKVEAQPFADRIFLNGKVYTADANQSFAEALAIKGDRILFVGTQADAMPYIGTCTMVEDVSGKLLLPGIHDVHMHPLEAGSPIGGDCSLSSEEEDPEELGFALSECGLTANANGWMISAGHSIFTLLEGERLPKEILDEYFPNTPVVILEETSHSVWVNSVALAQLNITAATPNPIGGHIFKDDNTNEPIGVLMDNAGDVALQAALASNPTIDDQNYDGLVNYSLPLLAQHGITSICEGRTYWKRNYHEIWKDLKEDGALTVRVMLNLWGYPDDDDADLIPMLEDLYDEGDDLLRATQVKVYSDGIIPNVTAAVHDPYVDNHGFPFANGLNYFDGGRLKTFITALEQIGFDFHIHAVGDRGVTESLDAIEMARSINGDMGARHRITHVEIVKPEDYERFHELNVIADMQVAGEFTQPVNWSEVIPLLGADRANNIVPLKSIFNTGAMVTLSSDWDVNDINPFVGMENALTRSPQELSTVADAVDAYTINGAYTMRQEDKTGSLEIGKYADFVCVDRDIFTIPTNQINQTKVNCTFLGGQEVYRNNMATPTEGSPILLKGKVFLEGCYNSATQTMTTTLQTNGLLPLQQPYHTAPWNYSGLESVATTAAFPANVTDWILVELRAANNIETIVAQQAALLLQDGTIVGVSGGTTAFLMADFCLTGDYYIAIRHRNHLPVISTTTVSLPNAAMYDFTSSESQVLGMNQVKLLGNNRYALRAGDVTANGVITVTDFNTYQAALNAPMTYNKSDCNLDGEVTIDDFNKYQPNASAIGVNLLRY